MKVVIDTNTFVSGIFWGGYPYKVLLLWRAQRFKLVANESILREYNRVINEIAQEKDSLLGNAWLQYILETPSLLNIRILLKYAVIRMMTCLSILLFIVNPGTLFQETKIC
jgi:predicted nucleic acid-binding protein